jgi:hypothetical protein
LPIPFRNAAQLEAGGNAAFVRIVPGREPNNMLGAILQVNALGEPVEFVFNRMVTPGGSLWRGSDLRRNVNRSLLASLFEAALHAPLVLCCLAAEIDGQTFSSDLLVNIPVCRIARTGDITGIVEPESREDLDIDGTTAHVFWPGAAPSAESPQRKLLNALARRGLMLEPFDRVLAGLAEAIGPDALVVGANPVQPT